MKNVLKFSIILMVLFACQREKTDFLGPGYISAPKEFSVTSFTATPSPVNFTASTVSFNATFTHSVSWILTIKGQKSGAVCQLNGVSNNLNNVIWKGTHDEVIFFRQGETVVATLSFFGNTYTASTTLVISTPRNFAAYGQFPVIGDFEVPTLVEPQPTPPYYSPYWASFNYPTPIPNVEQGVDSMAIDYNGSLVPSVEGSQYYFIRGKGNQQVFVSGLQYFGPLSPFMPNNPDNVWVNIYIYGTGDPNTAVELEYQEDDEDGSIPNYQGTDDDAFVTHIVLDHKGWKLFSFKYSSLYPSLNANFGGSGNKIHEPHRLKSFDLVLLKQSNPDKPVEVYIDFPILTVGGPFNPSK